VGLLDGDRVKPESKLPKFIVAGVIVASLAALGLWHVFRFHAEKKTIESFLQALIANDPQQAYRIWKPQPSYSYQDFLEDWGPAGHYGPVRSYRIQDVRKPEGGSGVIFSVMLSPYESFPGEGEAEKRRRTKTAAVWVEERDHSLSFPP
jgi:hypothetical protein